MEFQRVDARLPGRPADLAGVDLVSRRAATGELFFRLVHGRVAIELVLQAGVGPVRLHHAQGDRCVGLVGERALPEQRDAHDEALRTGVLTAHRWTLLKFVMPVMPELICSSLIGPAESLSVLPLKTL